jgi:hypothetical protein
MNNTIFLWHKGVKTIGYGHACHVGNKCADIKAPITRAEGEIFRLYHIEQKN